MRRLLLLLAAMCVVAACTGDDDQTDATLSSVDAPSPDDTGVAQTPPQETTPGLTTASTSPLDQPGENGDGTAPDTTVTGGDTQGAASADNQIQAVDSELGQIIADADGNTLYVFLPDEQGASTCYDSCEATWPPLAEAAAGAGADEGAIGTIERDDGTTQATYNGWPLYYYVSDEEPGMVSGQGTGDVWFVIDPSGEPVREENPES